MDVLKRMILVEEIGVAFNSSLVTRFSIEPAHTVESSGELLPDELCETKYVVVAAFTDGSTFPISQPFNTIEDAAAELSYLVARVNL